MVSCDVTRDHCRRRPDVVCLVSAEDAGLKVLVCGGRNYSDTKRLYEVLDQLQPSLVINGGASGADELSTQWARERGIEVQQFYAEWGRYGRKAGPIRNATMLANSRPNLVIAFCGGRGTADMIDRAIKLGVKVRTVT
jgi:predicted Rossmann-fold nucleotide-binding protein